MSFDFSSLDVASLADEGVLAPVPNPKTNAPLVDAEGKPVVSFRIHGQHSLRVREARRKVNQRRVAAMKAGQTEITPEQRDADDLEVLVAAVSDWTEFSLDGQSFEYSETNLRKLLGDRRFGHTKGWVGEYLNTDGNFMKG
ncbi:hypothetical protein [Azospirillum sp. TSO5]|uniref:hypothetical protein n=1 Tax=Azospirillum sp. TSO5 TaxID=716760 RepID=UPI000D6076FB|nr:hypothetical protein [Azospirillum sp. TSO5]PWC95461.1 hypothetical protein TSO5_10585 [Azospirillum sp. TSO5]